MKGLFVFLSAFPCYSMELSDLVYASATKKCIQYKERNFIQTSEDFIFCVDIGKKIALSNDEQYQEYAWKCFEKSEFDFDYYFSCAEKFKVISQCLKSSNNNFKIYFKCLAEKLNKDLLFF